MSHESSAAVDQRLLDEAVIVLTSVGRAIQAATDGMEVLGGPLRGDEAPAMTTFISDRVLTEVLAAVGRRSPGDASQARGKLVAGFGHPHANTLGVQLAARGSETLRLLQERGDDLSPLLDAVASMQVFFASFESWVRPHIYPHETGSGHQHMPDEIVYGSMLGVLVGIGVGIGLELAGVTVAGFIGAWGVVGAAVAGFMVGFIVGLVVFLLTIFSGTERRNRHGQLVDRDGNPVDEQGNPIEQGTGIIFMGPTSASDFPMDAWPARRGSDALVLGNLHEGSGLAWTVWSVGRRWRM